MSTRATDVSETTALARMRREFDAGFSRIVEGRQEDLAHILRFRAGDARYAVEIAEVGEVHELSKVTRVPGHRQGFEGISAVRGQLVAVYDLAATLGGAGHTGHARWLLVARSDRHVGFSVASVDGYLAVPRSRLVRPQSSDAGHAAAHLALEEEDGIRLVLRFEDLLTELRRTFAPREAGP